MKVSKIENAAFQWQITFPVSYISKNIMFRLTLIDHFTWVKQLCFRVCECIIIIMHVNATCSAHENFVGHRDCCFTD